MTGPERDLALIVAGRATDAGDLRMLLDALGLLPPPGKARAHGRVRSYRAGCRCERCRAANAAQKRRARAGAAADPSRADRAGHGRVGTYKNYGCRCVACAKAANEWSSARWAAGREAS